MPARSRGGPGDSRIIPSVYFLSPTPPWETPSSPFPTSGSAASRKPSPGSRLGADLDENSGAARSGGRGCGAGPGGLQRAAGCSPPRRRASWSARSPSAAPLAVRPRVGPGEARGCGSASAGAGDGGGGGGGARCGWRAQAGAAGQHPLPARRASQPSPCAALCTLIHARRRPREAGGPSQPCRRLQGAGWRGPSLSPGSPTSQRPATAAWKHRVGGRKEGTR